MGLGDKFRKEREKQGYSLEFIEEETKIRKLYLESIENENFAALPPKVYAIGFIKRYAKFLNLDEQQMVAQFKELAFGNEIDEEAEVVIKDKKVRKIPVKNIVAGIIFLLIALWIGNYMADYFSMRGAEQYNDNPPGIQKSDKVGDTAPQPQVKAEEEKANVLVEAEQDCWLHVKVDGAEVFKAILPAGNSKSFEGNESVYLKAGNAGGIRITFNGKEIQPLGGYGEVKEKEFVVRK